MAALAGNSYACMHTYVYSLTSSYVVTHCCVESIETGLDGETETNHICVILQLYIRNNFKVNIIKSNKMILCDAIIVSSLVNQTHFSNPNGPNNYIRRNAWVWFSRLVSKSV